MPFLLENIIQIVLVALLPLQEVKDINFQVTAYPSTSYIITGKQVYMQHCMVCHQKNGLGIKPLYPPLTDLYWLQRPDEELISIILEGQKGAIKVNGDTYNVNMAPLDYLDNNEVALVLNYIRQTFGKLSSEITPAQVQKVRSELKAAK